MLYLDKIASLTPQAYRVICEHATEAPFSGSYVNETQGSYLCRRCGWALFRGTSQFSAGCGWPSFDDALLSRVKECPDPDGQRIEIRCSRCEAHLGHVFRGEHFTAKNQRYCVNAVALDFVIDDSVLDTEEAIVAGGCFWGVDYYLGQISGVLKIEVGYTGGCVPEPTYHDVCRGLTGHYEAVRVIFDTKKIDYRNILQHFFEIHDPTQSDGQGVDRGLQYQSAIFYYNRIQHENALALVALLQQRGYQVATSLRQVDVFWKAEEAHQQYYIKHSAVPYCHQRIKRFG